MTLLPYRLSLFCLLLTITLPFLGAHHYQPIATFHQEWLAGMLGLTALLPLAFSRDERPWKIPKTALLPLALVVLAWIQFATGGKVLFESIVLLSLYLVWAFALMLALCRIESTLGRETVADTIAWSLLAGALLVATTGALQKWAPSIGMPYIFPLGGSINGNIAQANNFADYLWLGLVSALYLHGRGKLGTLPLWLTLPILLSLSLLSGSRSVYFFAVASTLWLLLWSRTMESTHRKRILASALLLLPALLGLQWLIDVAGTPVASAQRIVAQGSYDPVRLTLWRAALEIFSEHPLLGAGFDSFSREYFTRIARFPINGAGIPEHSHNLLTEMLAEFGIAGFVLVSGTAIFWLLSLRNRHGDTPKFLALGVLLILGTHSGLEYPLWYAHFLAIAVLMLALGEGRRWQISMAQRHRMALAAIAVIGASVLIGMRADYIQLETAAHGRSTEAAAAPLSQETRLAWLLDSYTRSLWRYHAALQFAAQMPIEAKDVAYRLKLMEEALNFSPIRQGAFRYAALLQLDGQTEAAREQLERAMRSYPGDIPVVERQFEFAASEAPALKTLLEQLRQRNF